MIETTFEFVRGTTYSRNFNIFNFDSEISNIYFTVKANESDKKPVITKKLGSGISVLSPIQEDAKTYNLLIDADDTEKLTINKPYYFDIKVVVNHLNSPPTKKVIIKGELILSSNITRSFNEK